MRTTCIISLVVLMMFSCNNDDTNPINEKNDPFIKEIFFFSVRKYGSTDSTGCGWQVCEQDSNFKNFICYKVSNAPANFTFNEKAGYKGVFKVYPDSLFSCKIQTTDPPVVSTVSYIDIISFEVF